MIERYLNFNLNTIPLERFVNIYVFIKHVLVSSNISFKKRSFYFMLNNISKTS